MIHFKSELQLLAESTGRTRPFCDIRIGTWEINGSYLIEEVCETRLSHKRPTAPDKSTMSTADHNGSSLGKASK
jgi:hypothetical protein